MKKLTNLINKNISLIVFIILLAIWEILGKLNMLPRFILPTPSKIFFAFINDINELLKNSAITLMEAFIGIGVGIILAFILAIIMDMCDFIRRALYPILIVTQTIPTIAIAPILVLWLGYGILPKIVLVVITTLFPIIIGILNGFANCDKDSINLLRLMNASKLQILYHIKLPQSLGYFFAGLRISISYAIISAVVAEWLGGFEGLGVYMIRVKKAFSYDKMFAVIIFVSIISLILMKLVGLLENHFLNGKYKRRRNEKN